MARTHGRVATYPPCLLPFICPATPTLPVPGRTTTAPELQGVSSDRRSSTRSARILSCICRVRATSFFVT